MDESVPKPSRNELLGLQKDHGDAGKYAKKGLITTELTLPRIEIQRARGFLRIRITTAPKRR